MPHPVVYRDSMKKLLSDWDSKYRKAFAEHGRAGLLALKIGDGECVALPQKLTSAGWTGRWQRGERVIDVAGTLKPGTVVANFKMIEGRWQYPRGGHAAVHGLHAALFVGGESFVGGQAQRIRLFDQWKGKWPGPRGVSVAPENSARKPCDRAEEFYVVLVP